VTLAKHLLVSLPRAGLMLAGIVLAAHPASAQYAYIANEGANNTTPTFSIFVTAKASVPLNAATSRLFVRFLDASGGLHGETSVAAETQ